MLIQPGELHFSEYLKRLPPAWVIEHFFSDGASERKILSSAMIDECARQFAAADSLHLRFEKLEHSDRLRCAVMYLMGTAGLGSPVQNGLDDPIVASFLGYAARDTAGKLRIFGFESFETVLRKHLIEVILKSGSRAGDAAVTPICRWRCLNDIALVASLAEQHLLIKKRSGKLGVAALQTMRKLLHIGDLHKAEDVEAIAGAITRYCVARGLFIEDEKEFFLDTDAYGAWQVRSIDERIDDVVGLVAEQGGGWNTVLLGALCAVAGARWVSTAGFPEGEFGRVRETLLALQFAGTVEARRSGTEVVFQQTPAPGRATSQPDGRVVVMPDFTVVATQECDPDILFECARFCKVTTLDRVYHGTIDRGTLIEAVSAGFTGVRILGFLKQWNAPVNVIESVREWIREFDRISISTDPVVLCAESAVADQIAACEALRPLLERIEVNSVFRIKAGGERAVRDIVRKLGFDERMPLQSGNKADARQEVDELLAAPEETSRWALVTDQEPTGVQSGPAIRGSKYGAEMKTLELSEVVQVIDYAILTGQRLVISYEGSPYVRKGIYTIVPLLCGKGIEPLLDGELERTGSRKQFYIKKIGAIGVVPQ